MSKMQRLLQILMVLVLLSPLDSIAQGNRWFTLVNQSGYNIDFVWVRPMNTVEWSDDVLGQDSLASGQRLDITWTGGKPPKVFDVHIQYEDGETAECPGLCYPGKANNLVIYWDQTTLARWE